MTIQEAKKLLIKYREGRCSPEEETLILQWYQSLLDEEAPPALDREDIDEIGARLRANITARLEEEAFPGEPELGWQVTGGQALPVRHVPMWPRWAAAICLTVLVGTGYWWLTGRHRPEASVPFGLVKKDIGPGGNKAVLTLGDGSVIDLSGRGGDTLIRQGTAQLATAGNGKLTYRVKGAGNIAGTNTITTPRGGQYQVVLPDGTEVWLNAASSLTFPTVFTGATRQVTLKGEAYFQVAPQRRQPFEVLTGETSVQVLGTHFDINAYNDEPVQKTTLLEGSIRVCNGGQSALLHPGQEAVIAGASMHVGAGDPDLAVAWKNGFISFRGADIQTIMRMIEKWYDVSVSYQGNIPDRTFTGEISRSANLSELLRVLQANNIHFNVEEKKIIVSP